MSAPIEYTVMGEDGHEYGPVSAGQIRQWIAEQRLEKKTPVKPSNAKDWIFLGELPEFASFFPSPAFRPPAVPPRRGLVVAFLLIGLAVGFYYLFKYITPH